MGCDGYGRDANGCIMTQVAEYTSRMDKAHSASQRGRMWDPDTCELRVVC